MELVNREMVLNAIGLIAKNGWMQILEYLPFMKTANPIVIPYHTHCIEVIDKPDDIRIDDCMLDMQCIGYLPCHLPHRRCQKGSKINIGLNQSN